MIVLTINSNVIIIMFEGGLLFQELNYCGDLFSGVIFRYHILLNFFAFGTSLHSTHSSHIFAVVGKYACNIIVQVK